MANDRFNALENRYTELEVSHKSEADRAMELGLMIADLKKKLQDTELQVQTTSKPRRKTGSPVEQEENGGSGASAGWSDVGELDVGDEAEPRTAVEEESEVKKEEEKKPSPRESPSRKDSDITNVMELANLRSEIRKLEGERDRFK